jgi:hypothetical protein
LIRANTSSFRLCPFSVIPERNLLSLPSRSRNLYIDMTNNRKRRTANHGGSIRNKKQIPFGNDRKKSQGWTRTAETDSLRE